MAGDRIIVIKKPDKGSCVVVWDRYEYLMEAKKNLRMGKCIIKSGLVNMSLLIMSKKQYHVYEFFLWILSIFPLNTRKLSIQENYTYYLKSISASKMYLVDQSFLIAESQSKKYQSFLTITLSQSWQNSWKWHFGDSRCCRTIS